MYVYIMLVLPVCREDWDTSCSTSTRSHFQSVPSAPALFSLILNFTPQQTKKDNETAAIFSPSASRCQLLNFSEGLKMKMPPRWKGRLSLCYLRSDVALKKSPRLLHFRVTQMWFAFVVFVIPRKLKVRLFISTPSCRFIRFTQPELKQADTTVLT